jgi:serine/threonine protein kinase
VTFAPGTVLDRYVVEGVLGQGGMAMVYRVRHVQLGTIHALKVLHAPNPGVRDRFLQEGRVQGQLRHPNIVPVTDLVEIAGAPGLVMEFVDGPSLEALLERYRPTLEQADALAQGILEGVAHAHRQGFIHRDLKPANVLLAMSPAGLVPKVADFGLAKMIRGESDNMGQTRSGMIMGTPSYMAPEQIRDSKNVDHRADIFSLGVILYELLAGKKPFEGADIVQLYTAITKGQYAPISEVVPGIPDRMERAIAGALVTDRNARTQDAEKLLTIWRGDGKRANSTWDHAITAAQAAMPAKFDPQPVGDSDREITFHDRGPTGDTAVPSTTEHPVLAKLGEIKIASPDQSVEQMLAVPISGRTVEGPALALPIAARNTGRTPAPAGVRLASIDPSGQAEDDDDLPPIRRGLAPVVALVAVALFGLAVVAAGGAVVAGLVVFPGSTTATAVEPPPEVPPAEGEAAVKPEAPQPPTAEASEPAKADPPKTASTTPPPKSDPPKAEPKPEPRKADPPKKVEPPPPPPPDTKSLLEGLGDDEEPAAEPAPAEPAPAEPKVIEVPAPPAEEPAPAEPAPP